VVCGTGATMSAASHRAASRAAENAGDFVAAERELRAGLDTDPGDGDTIFALAEFLARRGRFTEAEPYYRRLIEKFPDEPALLNGVAVLLLKTGRRDEAIGLWRRVRAARPKLAAPLVNIGLALRDAGDAAGAVAQFEQAIAVEPGAFDAHYNLGVTLFHGHRYEAAIAALEAALRLRPDSARAAAMLAQTAQALCDWDRLDRMMPALRDEAAKAAAGKACAVSPRFSLLLPFSRAERKAIAAMASRAYEEAAAPLAAGLGFRFDRKPKDHLTLGYFAADFREHPGMQLTAGLYRRHDRARFRVHAYSVNRPDAYGMSILKDGCDSVVDLTDLSEVEAARRIHGDGVDILIDISGFTTFMRPGILALRPAAVQVSWLGFAGTLSGRLYDYLIGDSVVTPPEHAGDYLETLARLSGSYQINNIDQEIVSASSRAAEGLPEKGFIFACFCAAEKIERTVFTRWMDILRQCPGAVLWLFGETPVLQENLRRAAAAHGIDATRMIFAGRRPRAHHLGRLALADLHFDTGTYGAHTTGSDALWAGVPLLTMLGDAFPARVGASLLQAVNLPELIATNWESYVRLAIDLAGNPARLAAIRRKLSASRRSARLFDTARTVRDLETLYEKMWQAHLRGGKLAPIDP
jgi:predicted O-linked N-acetylglucosamine transferase (SPINDLY family)